MIQLFEHGYIDFDFDLYPFNKDGYQLIIASKCKGVIYENDLFFFDNIMYNYNSLQELRDAISDYKLIEILYTKKVILFLSIQDIYKFLCLYLKIDNSYHKKLSLLKKHHYILLILQYYDV